jgi:Uma2 family endonuclease
MRDGEVTEDHIVVLRNATWADYQRHLEIRGEKAVPRISYLEGALQIMSPSQEHEVLKYMIGRLVEAWCFERGVDFRGFGSWTLESKESARGVEPDECFAFGTEPSTQRPDLAIEVVWTSGGLNKLEIYRKLGVREVWFWRKGGMTVHCLRDGIYVEAPRSEVLDGIDLAELASYLDRPIASQAIREYRAALAARR